MRSRPFPRLLGASHATAWLLAALLALGGCDRAPENELWLIGLDGADWDVLDPMIAAGELPNLAQLRREGAYGRLLSDEPMLSPILWTSIATGKTADLHGVTWFMSDAPDGSKIPVSSHNRWVRAVWTMASEADMDVGVVGWWATWPADPVKGFIVSDYVGWHSFGVSGRDVAVEGKTFPAELNEEIQAFFPPPASIDLALVKRMVHLPDAELVYDETEGAYAGAISHLRQAISTTIGYTDLTIDRIRSKRPALLAVYFEGTDAIAHLFHQYEPPQLPWISDEDFAAYRDVVREYWKWQDEQLGRLLAERSENTTIMIVSDHGFRTGDERLKEDDFTIERADASHLPDGVVLLHGPQIAPSARIENADIYDVTPTALHLLDLAVADDMEGRVLSEALTAESIRERPIRSVASYETGDYPRGELVFEGIDGSEMEEMLRSLGYIGGGESNVGTTGNIEQAVNLAVVQRRRGKLAEAEATLMGALETAPGHVEARSNLARVLVDQGRIAEAEAIFGGLLEESPQDLTHREDYALALGHQGKSREALRVYDEGLELASDWAIGHGGRSLALVELDRADEALVSVDRALELDPSLANAHYHRGLILEQLERPEEARAAYERALQLQPGHAQAALRRAQLAGESANPAAVLAALEAMRAQQPGDPEVAAQLGAEYLRLERVGDALPHLVEASEKLPDDAAVQGNAGMALAMSGDFARAITRFERVVELEPKNAEAAATLGQLCLQAGRPEQAERVMRRAVELSPEDARIRYGLGEFYHRTGQLDLAQEQYEEAVRLDPETGAYLYQLAMVYGQKGDEARAVELIRQARQLDPTLPPPPGP